MSRISKFFPGLLFGLTLALGTSTALADSVAKHEQFIVVGKTSQQEVRKKLGAPQETISAEEVDVWVYTNKLEIPTAISFIPIIGDFADIFEMVHNIDKNHELIIQFDPTGIVKKAKLRELE